MTRVTKGNWRPGKNDVSLFCLPLCCARCLWFWLRLAGWLPCWEIASHTALRVCCRKNCYVV